MRVVGTIRGLGLFYTSGLERLEIWVDKKVGQCLPYKDGTRIPVTLVIGSGQYTAGIRSTRDNTYIWICPDLRDKNNQKVSLAHALQLGSFKKNQRVYLEVAENQISVVPV